MEHIARVKIIYVSSCRRSDERTKYCHVKCETCLPAARTSPAPRAPLAVRAPVAVTIATASRRHQLSQAPRCLGATSKQAATFLLRCQIPEMEWYELPNLPPADHKLRAWKINCAFITALSTSYTLQRGIICVYLGGKSTAELLPLTLNDSCGIVALYPWHHGGMITGGLIRIRVLMMTSSRGTARKKLK